MKPRLLLLVMAAAALLAGCVTSAGYGSHAVDVGYAYGQPSASYRYQQRGYPGSYGYYGRDDYYRRDGFYGSVGYGGYGGYGGYDRYDPYNRYGYGGDPYRGYPYAVPRYRGISPPGAYYGGGFYYGNPYYGNPYYGRGYQDPRSHHPHVLPRPRHGGLPPWRNTTPPPVVTPLVPPPSQPDNIDAPRARSGDGTERGLRRLKGSEAPVSED